MTDSIKTELNHLKQSTAKYNFSVVELFAGAGGLALGLEKAGFDTKLTLENNKWACETLRKNRPHWNVLEADVAKIADDSIKKYLNFDGEIDLLSGGYPCQAFSYAGKKLGLEDTRGTLFYSYAEILKELKPKMFLAENVKGLVSHDNGRTLQTMIGVFEEVGYKVYYQVLSSVNYDVAQKRERVAIIGVRNDIQEQIGFDYTFPQPLDKKLTLKDILQDVPKSLCATYSDKKKEIFALISQGGCWRDLPNDIAKEYLGGSYHLGGGKTGIARKMSWNEAGLTVLCTPAQKQTDRCHPDELRPFSVRENARIQSFPDDWEFVGGMAEQYKQIGNAVPVNLAYHIGLSIKNYLQGKKEKTMNNYNLNFISNQNLFNHVKESVLKYRFKIDLKEFNKNLIDPIKLTFDSKVYKKDLPSLINDEIMRQIDKSNTNHIGYFHQNIFKYFGNRWSVPKEGFDIVNEELKIFVEMKNKHNTMNSSSSQKTYMRMQHKINIDPNAQCFLVEVIAKNSQNIRWTISLDNEQISDERIRRISIDTFYEIVTGEKQAFKQLCEKLPLVIDDILTTLEDEIMQNSVFEELQKISPNILKSLYLLSFSKYEGFGNFDI